jgi:hypothetical protein
MIKLGVGTIEHVRQKLNALLRQIRTSSVTSAMTENAQTAPLGIKVGAWPALVLCPVTEKTALFLGSATATMGLVDLQTPTSASSVTTTVKSVIWGPQCGHMSSVRSA